MLDVSRIVHGKLELARAPADLHGCIREALEVCQEDFTAKQLVLSVQLEAKDTRILADEARSRQVFWNLFKNAAKFTPQGGRMSVRSSNVNKRIVVEVTDSGIGIAADALPKIFDALEQGDPDRASRYGGLGVGDCPRDRRRPRWGAGSGQRGNRARCDLPRQPSAGANKVERQCAKIPCDAQKNPARLRQLKAPMAHQTAPLRLR